MGIHGTAIVIGIDRPEGSAAPRWGVRLWGGRLRPFALFDTRAEAEAEADRINRSAAAAKRGTRRTH